MDCVIQNNINSSKLTGTGANGYGARSGVELSMGGALVTEVVLTFVFVLAILGVTSNGKTSAIFAGGKDLRRNCRL